MANVGTAASGKTLIGAGQGVSPEYANIGTNSGLTARGLVVAEGNGAFQATSAGTAGQVIQSGGASANPSYSTATYPSTSGSTGSVLRSDGTNWTGSTATYPNTTIANQILYSSATNTVGQITGSNNGVLITSAAGVPSLLAAGTTGQVLTATTGSAPSWGPPPVSFTWTVIAANQALAVNNGYIVGTGALSLSLPASAAVGDTIEVVLEGGTSWTITQGAGQQIRLGNATTTSGAGGSLASAAQGDWVQLVCRTANTFYVANAKQGNITIV